MRAALRVDGRLAAASCGVRHPAAARHAAGPSFFSPPPSPAGGPPAQPAGIRRSVPSGTGPAKGRKEGACPAPRPAPNARRASALIRPAAAARGARARRKNAAAGDGRTEAPRALFGGRALRARHPRALAARPRAPAKDNENRTPAGIAACGPSGRAARTRGRVHGFPLPPSPPAILCGARRGASTLAHGRGQCSMVGRKPVWCPSRSQDNSVPAHGRGQGWRGRRPATRDPRP